ncbi:MAG: hypothetical protein F4X03_06855 [Dehalococcoidia bacterium]|nr:hypothetical protein [Dehalococcoidia bacterium]MYD28614.1 hypothetical protein [Dehalococcoidia bacterium]
MAEEKILVIRFTDGSIVELKADGIDTSTGALKITDDGKTVASFVMSAVSGWWEKDALYRKGDS